MEIGGVRRQANVAFIEDPKVGDYVLLHAGFAIRKWSEEDVREYEAILAGSSDLWASREEPAHEPER